MTAHLFVSVLNGCFITHTQTHMLRMQAFTHLKVYTGTYKQYKVLSLPLIRHDGLLNEISFALNVVCASGSVCVRWVTHFSWPNNVINNAFGLKCYNINTPLATNNLHIIWNVKIQKQIYTYVYTVINALMPAFTHKQG